jgi:hypothetical protein
LNLNNPRQPWEFVAKIGSLCVDLHHEKTCGRILGLEFDKNGLLYVCDAYYGLYKVRLMRLGSEAEPVIQATGRSEFEDGLGSGDFVSGYSYHTSVRTGLPDHTMQTKLQSQTA